MNIHDHMTLEIGILFASAEEQLCLFLSKPFGVNADGTLYLLDPQPSAEDSAKLVRDAAAHHDIGVLFRQVLDADAAKS